VIEDDRKNIAKEKKHVSTVTRTTSHLTNDSIGQTLRSTGASPVPLTVRPSHRK